MTSALKRLSIWSLQLAPKQSILLLQRGNRGPDGNDHFRVIVNGLHAQGWGGGRTELSVLRQAPSQTAPWHASVCKVTAWPTRPELPEVLHSTSHHTCLKAPKRQPGSRVLLSGGPPTMVTEPLSLEKPGIYPQEQTLSGSPGAHCTPAECLLSTPHTC